MARRDGIDPASLDRVAALVDRDAHLDEVSFRVALAMAGWPDFLRDRAVCVVRSEHAALAAAKAWADRIGVSGLAGIGVLAYAIARWLVGAGPVHAAMFFALTAVVATVVWRRA